jgi:hypothetical protein
MASAAQCALWVWRSHICRRDLILSSRGTWRSRLSRAGQTKREIAPQARLSMSSRGTWRSRLFRAGQTKREIASQARNDRPFVIASAAQCALWVWRSRLFRVGRQKREIASQACFSMSSRGTWRFRLFWAGKQKREIASRARNDNTPVIARNVAISIVKGWQTEKRDCFAGFP